MVNSISSSFQSAQPNLMNSQNINPTSLAKLEPTSIESETAKNTTSAETSTEPTELTAEKAKEVTDSINEILNTTSTKLRYQYHEKLDKYYVTLVDTETEEVVREIPNKKLLDVYAAMLDFVGVLVDEKI